MPRPAGAALAALAAGLAALAAGASCGPHTRAPGAGGQRDRAPAGGQAARALPTPDFLHQIPADAPFVYAALEPPPPAYVEREHLAGLAAFEPVRQALASRTPEQRRAILARLDLATRARLALLELTGGQATASALSALGLDPAARFALHGQGTAAVLRIELPDPDRFAATLERMVDLLGPLERGELHGRRFLRLRAGEQSWVVAIAAGHLVLASVPPAAEASALPLVLGLRQPERSLADARHLERVAAELGASPAGLGYVDLPLLARAHGAALPDPCGAELAGLAALVPRISIGLRRATAGRLHVVSAAETRRDVTDALLALRGTVPAADPDVPVPASAVLGLAIDAAAAIRVVGGALDQVVESPYRCPALGWLNRGARDLRALLRTGALGLLRQVRGVSLLILPGEPGAGGAPARPVEGALLFLGSDDPRALLAQLSALTHIPVPKLAPGDPPAEIAAGAAMPLGPVHVALGARSLGVSLGGHQTELGELIAAAPPADPPLVFLRTIPRDSGSLLELVTGRAGRSDPALAGEDPEIARLVAAARDRPLARYEEVTTTARASSRGLEIQLTARYPR